MTTQVTTPTSRCRFGIGRVEITPPVGIYHRFWGAARHDRATGVHQPLTATVVLFGPREGNDELHCLVALDHCLFRDDDMRRLRTETTRATGLPDERLTFTFSHTHAAGNICRSRASLPGGELIAPYLDALPGKIAEAAGTARDATVPATLTYGRTFCDMGQHRDYRDAARNEYVCGFDPERPLPLPLNVVRVTDETGAVRATLVNYPCHPTTLAWDNTLISPDYVGAVRETVETATGAPCVFLLAACGNIGPRRGFVGETAVAEANGRQVGHAALSVLESMPRPGTDYHYTGPVVSGATIGLWEYRPHGTARTDETALFRHCRRTIDLPYKPDLPSLEEAERELQSHPEEEKAAREAVGPLTQNPDRGGPALELAQKHRALAERKRRLLERLRPLPPGAYPYLLRLWQLGDAFWVGVEGEPYHELQQSLNGRFPDRPIIVFVLADGSRPSYLPARDAYPKRVYPVEVAVLEEGCLETVTEELAGQIEQWGALRAVPSR